MKIEESGKTFSSQSAVSYLREHVGWSRLREGDIRAVGSWTMKEARTPVGLGWEERLVFRCQRSPHIWGRGSGQETTDRGDFPGRPEVSSEKSTQGVGCREGAHDGRAGWERAGPGGCRWSLLLHPPLAGHQGHRDKQG